MTLSERRQLARTLAEIDGPEDPGAPAPDPYLRDPALRRQRRIALLILAGCCVILAGWIVVLSLTLPHRFDAHHWRAVWVNFDLLLLVAFAMRGFKQGWNVELERRDPAAAFTGDYPDA